MILNSPFTSTRDLLCTLLSDVHYWGSQSFRQGTLQPRKPQEPAELQGCWVLRALPELESSFSEQPGTRDRKGQKETPHMTLIEGAGNCPGTTPVCENLQGLEGLGRMLAQRSSFQPGYPAQRRLPEGGPFSRQPQHVAAEDSPTQSLLSCPLALLPVL